MRAGTLSRRVTLQAKTGGVDPIGQPLPESWQDVATVWANIRFTSGLEAIKADAETSIAKASIRIRYRQVDAGMRVIYHGKAYEIKAVLPDEAGRVYVDLVCEVVDGGL